MAILNIECNVKNLIQYFNRDTFKIVNDDILQAIKVSKDIMNKYFHPRYKNDLLYLGNRYYMKKYLKNYTSIIFDEYTQNMFLGVENKTIMIEHQKPKKQSNIKNDQLSKENKSLIENKISKSQKKRGINKIEQDVIFTLKHFFPIDAYKKEWIVDLDLAYNSADFDLATIDKESNILKFATLIKDQMIILYANNNKELIKKFYPKATYRDGNPKIMNRIPSLIKKGDLIKEIFDCDKGIVVVKETGIMWFIVD